MIEPMFTPDPVRRPREQVEEQLRKAIVTGVFKRGDRLPSEVELAKEFHVARSTIREALQSLAADGLVTKSSGVGGGSFVQNIDHEMVRDAVTNSLGTILKVGALSFEEVMEVRRIVEVSAARLAASNRTEEQADSFRALLTRQEQLKEERELNALDPELLEIGHTFSCLIGEATANRLLGAFVSAMSHTILDVVRSERPRDDAERILNLRRALGEAVITRDVDAAEAATAELIGP